jgi:1,4-alpha-glucan branching enzyme
VGYLALVLHWHLPYVRHPEHARFLEEDWFFEAMSETYIPLLNLFERLISEGVRFRITLSISPTLAEMLRDELLRSRYLAYLDRMIELAGLEIRRTTDEPLLNRLAKMYLERYRMCRRVFRDRYRCNLLDGLIGLQASGAVDLICSAATHCFLPLFQVVPQAVKAQVQVAVDSHVRNFGGYPKGFWLPECGYYPGVEDHLKEQRLAYFFVETHGILYADEHPRYGVYAPLLCPNEVAAFGRDPESARSVWSSRDGYPGDPVYRDFYRDIGYDLPLDYLKPFLPDPTVRVSTGIKYHAITGPGNQKRLYNPKAAANRLKAHAGHFVSARIDQAARLSEVMDQPPLIVCPFDAELFGHWWFEGPQWLETVLRSMAEVPEILRLVTPGQYLSEHPEQQTAQPCFSSWGNKGYAEVWLEGSNDWVYRHLHQQAMRMSELVRRFPKEKGMRKRALDQAFREMLLAEASDWAFIMKTGTTVPYAVRRTKEHIYNFTRIYDSLMTGSVQQEWFLGVESRNNLFRGIDYRCCVA